MTTPNLKQQQQAQAPLLLQACRRPLMIRRPAVFVIVVATAWLLVLLRQHAVILKVLSENNGGVGGDAMTPPRLFAFFDEQQQASNSKPIISHGWNRGNAAAAAASAGGGGGGGGSDLQVSWQNNQKQQQQQQRHELSLENADAVFNGIPLVYQKNQPLPKSSVYCVGGGNGNDDDDNDDDLQEQSSQHAEDAAGSTTTTTSKVNSTAWMSRSCRFTNLCFDMEQQDFVVFGLDHKQDQAENQRIEWTQQQQQQHSVALGGINPRWNVGRGFDKGAWKVKWFPRRVVVKTSGTVGFYQMPDNALFLPFHSFAAHNVGHLLWDDFYPLASLLRLFHLLPSASQNDNDDNNKNKPLLVPVRQKIPYTLYASCDIRRNKRMQCAANFLRFLPLLGVDPTHFSVSSKFQFQSTTASTTNLQSPVTKSGGGGGGGQKTTPTWKSRYVCARTGLAGLGLLTDHGQRDHGWDFFPASSTTTTTAGVNDKAAVALPPPHNLGRSANFRAFRTFMVQNLQTGQLDFGKDVISSEENDGMDGDTGSESALVANVQQPSPRSVMVAAEQGDNDINSKIPWSHQSPIRVTFSLESSRDHDRRLSFTQQLEYLRRQTDSRETSDMDMDIQANTFWKMSLAEQVETALKSHIFVTACGGAAMTATFLPPGASLIVYYNETGSFDLSTFNSNGLPARLDWDLLSNIGHLRVHWLPINTMNEPADLELLHALLQHEVAVIRNL